MRCRRQCLGLTLIELMVTVLLVAIFSAVAVPSMMGMVKKFRLDGFASELRTDLQYARTEAIRRREPVSLTVNAAGSGYVLTAVTSNTTLKTVSLPSGGALTTNATVSFDSLRGAAAAGAQFDAAASGSTDSMRIKVDTVGRVSACVISGYFNSVSTAC